MPTTSTPQTPSTTTPTPTPAPAASPTTSAVAITPLQGGNRHSTKIDVESAYQALCNGLTVNYAPTDTFALKGGTMTRDEIIAQAQEYLQAVEKTKASNQAWRSDVQAERQTAAEVEPIRQGVHSLLEARYGKDGTELLQYGFVPAKPANKTAASKAGAAAKAKKTRVLLGTKGSQQKKAAKAAAEDAAPAPTTAPSPAPAAAPSPAPAPAGGTTPHGS